MKQYGENTNNEVVSNEVINDNNINEIESLDEIQSAGFSHNEYNEAENKNNEVISDNILENLVKVQTTNNKEYRLKGDYNFQIISLFDKKNDLTDKDDFNVYKINISHPNKTRNQEDFVFFERNYNTVAFNDIINFISEKEKVDIDSIIQKKKYISGCKITDIVLVENEKKDPTNNNQSKYILKNFSIKYGDEKIQLFADNMNQSNNISNNKFSEEWLLKTFSPERVLKAGDTVSYGGQNKSVKHNRYKLDGDFDILSIKRDKAIVPKDANKTISWIPVEIQSRDENIPEKDRRFHVLVVDKMIDELDFLKNYKAFNEASPDDLLKKMTLRDVEINCQTFLGNNKKGETIELTSFNFKRGILSSDEYNVDLILSLNSKKKQPLFRLNVDSNSIPIFKDSGCTLNDIIGDPDKKIIADSFITIDGDFDIKSLRENMSPIAISDKAIVLTVKINGKEDGLEKLKKSNLDLYSLITNFGKKNKLASDKNSLVYNISLENSEIITPLLFILSNYDSDNMKEIKTEISNGDYPTSGIRINNPFLFVYDEPRNYYNRVIIQGGDIVLKNNNDEEVVYSVKSSDFSNFDFDAVKENSNFYISKISIITDKISKENNNALVKLGIFAESQLKDGDVIDCVYYNQKLEVPADVLERDIKPILVELKNRAEKQIKMPKVDISNMSFFKNEKNNLVLEKFDCSLAEKTTEKQKKRKNN